MSFQMDILIPLLFMGIGILLGIVVSAKITGFCLKKNRSATLSFILGLIIASSIVMIPLHAAYDIALILTSAAAFVFGGVVIVLLNKFV